MSMVTFCFMVGGAIGTSLGGRLIAIRGYANFFALYGFALAVLSGISLGAIAEGASSRSETELAV